MKTGIGFYKWKKEMGKETGGSFRLPLTKITRDPIIYKF